jgi:serine phosphatase RsbU (regulator of sigma subunit)
MMRSLVEDLSGAATVPGQLLGQMNTSLARVFKQSGTPMYATAFYLVADLAEGRMHYSSAAHPDPLHFRRSHGSVNFLNPGGARHKGPALGLFENSEFPTCECNLSPGDVLALFTDGLIETESISQEQYSAANLLEAARRLTPCPAREFMRGLIAEVLRFSERDEFDDDVCLVGMEVKQSTVAV